jgi:hypothetical protein
MARAYGHETLSRRYLQASRVIDVWREFDLYDFARTDGFRRRTSRFLGPHWRVRIDSPFTAAAKYPQVIALTRLLASPYWADLALRDHIAAGRPDTERYSRAAAVHEYRKAASGPPGYCLPDPLTPRDLVPELATGFLLEDGPGLRRFVDEVRRTVEPSYEWDPFPRRFLLGERHRGPSEPLASLVHDRAEAQLAKTVPAAGPGGAPGLRQPRVPDQAGSAGRADGGAHVTPEDPDPD